jgi:hypothetical protein
VRYFHPLNARFLWGFLSVSLAGGGEVCLADQPQRPLSFNRDVRPVLADKCFACHGLDAKKRKGGLRLDTLEGAYGRGESGEVAVVPGRPDQSEVWKRVNTLDLEDVMPPSKAHKVLTAGEKEKLRRWIENGALYQRHWAFEAPVKPTVPPSPDGPGSGNAVDAFLLQRLREEGLTYSQPASKETLVRRVTLALTGVPPSLQEVDAFLADSAPDAYERWVDRLLGSQRYGEQMARHWLDVARYGDTHGLHLDNERSMWPYRDWVVGAFNRNLSFKRFTVEQVAGDLLPNPSQDQLVATGFNRCNVTTNEGGAIAEEFAFRYAVDRTSTLAQAWMGLTAGCAVCHDHKFDPLSQREFYQLYAFYNSSADPAMDGNALLTAPLVKLFNVEQGSKMAEFDRVIAAASGVLKETIAKLDYEDPAKVVPPGTAKEETWVVLDDDFPNGANVVVSPAEEKVTWVTKETGPVCSGKRSLKISGHGFAQNYYRTGAAPVEVPPCGKITLMVFLDPVEPPPAVMVQVHTDSWSHRAIWGDREAISLGIADSPQRHLAGDLPSPGNWAQLEVDAGKLGLKVGDQILGFALTLNKGAAYFDQLNLVGRVDAANDAKKSLSVWIKEHRGKDTQGLPAEVLKILKVPVEERSPEQEQELRDYYLAHVCADTKKVVGPLQEKLQKLKAEKEALDQAIPASLIMRDLQQPRDTFVMERGAYDRRGEKVTAGVPAFLPPLSPANPAAPNRLDLARWLVSEEHPLTARVAVNRFWQQFFGVGLVRSSEDFGAQGEAPMHPELLDWLAVHFRETGWDVKMLVRLLVTSTAYRQSAAGEPRLWQRDPENRLLARGVRFRLDAEEIRDQALALSGLLKEERGGKGVRTYQPANIWEPVGFVGSNTRFYKQDSGASLYRRSIYTFLKRTAPPPFMANFDAPSREQTCGRRERSDTPLQALQLMNDVQFVEASRALAQRILLEGGSSAEGRIEYGFRLVLGRRPGVSEVEAVKMALSQHVAAYQARPEAASKLVRSGESLPKEGLVEAELAAWTLVANLLLNLDEAINLQ